MSDTTNPLPYPPLPEHVGHLHSNGDYCADRKPEASLWWPAPLFTEDQMRAYVDADRAQRAQPEAQSISAKPIVWRQDNDRMWVESDYGFYITLDDPTDADADNPYFAAWGEGPEDRFASLEDAQRWCQRQIDGLFSKYAVTTAALYAAPPLEQGQAALREERERCAMEVWYCMQEATAPDADDMGLEGWLREAERRIRARCEATTAQAAQGQAALRAMAVAVLRQLEDANPRYEVDLDAVRAIARAALSPLSSESTQAAERSQRFGDLLCDLIAYDAPGLPDELLERWQDATDEHIAAMAQTAEPKA